MSQILLLIYQKLIKKAMQFCVAFFLFQFYDSCLLDAK
jgi:hypothetical protein